MKNTYWLTKVIWNPKALFNAQCLQTSTASVHCVLGEEIADWAYYE